MPDGGFPLVTLVVLDGWGCAPPGPGNAVELARTPVFDRLWREFPHGHLDASGEAVGLPPGQMGNSEVGHLTIGSGRVLFQDLQRVNVAIRDGSFFENAVLRGAFERARARGGDVHLLGLVSYGGVHSHIDHVRALLDAAERAGMGERTWIHAFTDGRDVSPTAAANDLAELPPDRIATVVGRYYAMDRDRRWERTELALAAIVAGQGVRATDAVGAVRESYGVGITDEFVQPVVLAGAPRLTQRDTAIFFNFRPDRGRQLSEKLLVAGIDLTTMTRYREDFDAPAVFGEQEVRMTLAETLAAAGVPQLHAAETEKYAHVTYFFNGGDEREWPGETRVLVPSPRDVPSYDLKPEMSARELTARVLEELRSGRHGFCVVNFANPDMVGHTGSIPAVKEAVEVVDECLGRVVGATLAAGGACLVTADHGNAEQLLEADGVSPHTAHTTNPVPLVLTSHEWGLRERGGLADLAPTALRLLGLDIPAEMSGGPLATAAKTGPSTA
ncbi:MAG TPA: 2,3-bisphosphoglycerate-independent phosphoglycerate mutase [Gaiellaceae bacterium]|nr:2,3-bisphosphoglycerate-independent phosphoglycerate mutase [Gaiellaceae bacterium]